MEVLMTNRTPHIVGGGIGTLAKAEWERKQAAARRLVTARTPQVELAMSFVLRRKGFATLALAGMAVDDPQRVIFMDTLSTFKTAQPVKGANGKTVKGAIRVAAETAAEKNMSFFEDEATAEAALMASEWAQEALYWAGNKLHRSNKPQPSAAAPSAKAPATNAPTPAQVFGNKVPAA